MKELRRARWLPSVLAIALAMAMGLGCAATPKSDKAAKSEEAVKKGIKAKTPEKAWRFHDIANVEEVQKYAKIPKPENVVIIDSRPKRARYDKGYIPTAISIPDTKFDKMIAKLPQKKDTLLIFYCQGPT